MHRLKYLVFALTWMGVAALAKPIGPYPFMHVSELPDSLRSVWKELKPEMNEMSHCAAAFDSRTDDSKMAFACSIYVKLSAVAQRKAIQHCDEQREARHIKAPCQLIGN